MNAGLFDLSYRKSKAVVITTPELLTGDYLRMKPEADKIAIKKAIESGVNVEGAFLEERQNLQIK